MLAINLLRAFPAFIQPSILVGKRLLFCFLPGLIRAHPEQNRIIGGT